MSFLDDVSSFFGMGDSQPEGPITVPLPYDDATGANDQEVIRAQQDYAIASAAEDALKAREPEEQAQAEGRQSADWMQKAEQAQAEHDALKQQYESARTKSQGGDLYDDEKQALYQKYTAAYQKLQGVKDFNVFKLSNPLSKYMNQQFIADQKAAGLARMQAQQALDAAKRAAAKH